MEHLQELVARRYRTTRCRALAAAVASIAVLGTGAAAASGPRATTVVTFPGVARSFDADAGRVAWIDSAWILHVRPLRSGAGTTIRYTNPYQEVPSASAGPPLVLGRRRLLWLSTRGVAMFEDADRVYVASVGATRGRRLTNAVHSEGGAGGYVTGLAGDDAGFAYGTVTVDQTETEVTRYQVSGGGVWTLAGAMPRRLPGAPPAVVLAESAGRIAIAPVDTGRRGTGTPVAGHSVEIRNATTGAVVSSVSTTGAVRAAALSPTTLTVILDGRLAYYRVADGRLLGYAAIPADTAAELDGAGARVAFRRTRSIGVADTTSGRVSTVVTTSWRPTGVALDGGTLAWAESRRVAPGEVSRKTYTARVRTLVLPSANG
jgi:hypothetical protein